MIRFTWALPLTEAPSSALYAPRGSKRRTGSSCRRSQGLGRALDDREALAGRWLTFARRGDHVFELVAELAHHRPDRHRHRVAEHAEAVADDVLLHRGDDVEVHR